MIPKITKGQLDIQNLISVNPLALKIWNCNSFYIQHELWTFQLWQMSIGIILPVHIKDIVLFSSLPRVLRYKEFKTSGTAILLQYSNGKKEIW